MNAADVLALVDTIDYAIFAGDPPATVCCVRAFSGHVVVGMSVPARANFFDEAIGRRQAHDRCIRQLIELERYARRRSSAVVASEAGGQGQGSGDARDALLGRFYRLGGITVTDRIVLLRRVAVGETAVITFRAIVEGDQIALTAEIEGHLSRGLVAGAVRIRDELLEQLRARQPALVIDLTQEIFDQ